MPDYGHPLQFGLFVVPDEASYRSNVELVQRADRLGLDLIGIQDHPYQRRYLDTLALVADLLARTDRLTFFTDVVSLPLRPPAVLAKTAATLDVMSGGRFELGLGAGGFWDAIEGYGGPRRTPGQALRALEEAIEVIRLIWSGDRSLRFEGEHYSLKGVHSGPVPRDDLGIWLGVGGPRALALTGRSADGWVPSIPSMPIESLAERHARIDEAAVGAGRQPSDIRRIANVNGLITDGASEGFLTGPPDQWRDELADLALTFGFDSFVLWSKGDLTEQTEMFAEMVGDVRELVESERAQSG